MKLYHGTTKAVALAAMTEGLKPRGLGPGRWEDNPSRDDCVYLTDAYAPYFAANAADISAGEEWAIVEVDTKLFSNKMLPDEDFLEQAARLKLIEHKAPYEYITWSMDERTAWFRHRLGWWEEHWLASLRSLGTCCALGEVPAEAITRVSIFNPATNPTAAFMALDPTISMLNYTLMGPKYRMLNRWFAGYDVDLTEWLKVTFALFVEGNEVQQKTMEHARKVFHDPNARTVVVFGKEEAA